MADRSADGSGNTAMTCLGGVVVLLILLVSLGGAVWLLSGGEGLPFGGGDAGSTAPGDGTDAGGGGGLFSGGETVTVGIAYGTEKKRWLEWAVEEFARTEAARGIRIDLIPMGSREGAQAVLDGDERIHVWSPASALYRDYFIQEWKLRHGGEPVVHEEPLALSPMVFVFWQKRYEAFSRHYPAVTFRTLGEALHAKGGWEEIAGKPQWGFFKFGHTHPGKSNSGGVALILMAYEFHDKLQGLTLEDIVDVKFQTWMRSVETAVSGLGHSTGTMMREMVMKGPSTYDALCVYENLAIDYLKSAQSRWDRLHVAYPKVNMWNENPYYVLDVPWSDETVRAAAKAFLEFLLSDPVQRRAIEKHGFRPANLQVPVKFPESPFVKYADFGLKIDIPAVAEPPKGVVVENLLQSWQRSQAGR